MRSRLLSLILVLCPASGVLGETVRHLPGLASADGRNGTRFESTVWITNLTASEARVALSFIGPDGVSASPVEVVLGPNATLFGLAQTFGTLRAGSSAAFAIRGRTDNVRDPAGRYGLALAEVPPEALLLAGETGHALWASNGAASRSWSNVTVTFATSGRAQVLVYDEAGFILGSTTLAAARPLTWQTSLADVGRESQTDTLTDSELPLARVELRVLEGEATGYVSVVDEVTGDGLLAAFERTHATALDGAAKVAGRGGSHWSTDLRLFNPSLAPLGVSLTPLGLPASARAFSRTVPPRGLVEIADVLGFAGSGLGEGAAGALRLVADRPFVPLARVVNRDPSGRPGTFGEVLHPIPEGSLVSSVRGVLFAGLSDGASSRSRTNLAFYSSSGGAADLQIVSATGTLVTSRRVDVPAGWTQRSLTDWVGAAVPDDARLAATAAAGAWDAYASVIDNGTGDAVVLRGTERAAPGCVTQTVFSFSVSRTDISPGDQVTFQLAGSGPPGASAVLVPGDVSFPFPGSVTVRPAGNAAYRVLLLGGCETVATNAIPIRVNTPSGLALTELGPVRGTVSGDTTAFLNILFAPPPVGALRFRPPVAPSPWSGVRDATAFGPACPQLDSQGQTLGDEDCLSLNVFSPAAPSSAPRPVLVFVHGGGHIGGAANLTLYDGRSLASLGDSVVVTIQYRLGAARRTCPDVCAGRARRRSSGPVPRTGTPAVLDEQPRGGPPEDDGSDVDAPGEHGRPERTRPSELASLRAGTRSLHRLRDAAEDRPDAPLRELRLLGLGPAAAIIRRDVRNRRARRASLCRGAPVTRPRLEDPLDAEHRPRSARGRPEQGSATFVRDPRRARARRGPADGGRRDRGAP